MKFNPLPWLLILAVLMLAWALRILYIEPQDLAVICESGVQDLPCSMRKWLTGTFYDNAVGYLVLALSLLTLVLQSGRLALLTSLLGMAGLVIHGGKHTGVEYVCFGFVLSFLMLARAEFQKYRHQHQAGQHQT